MTIKSLFFTALALSALAGCTPSFDHLDFDAQTTPPVSVSLLGSGITIPEGIAVAVTPVAVAGGERMEDWHVDIFSTNTNVIGVDRTQDEGYVIYGVSPGQAQITIFVDGSDEGSLPATVTAQ